MSRAVLSIGSNLGDRLGYLRLAADRLSPYLEGASTVYQTPAWGPVDQDDYYNAVLIVVDEHASPADWLARAQECEAAAERTRELRWGPRTLDVDVISVDDVISDDPLLTLPHPRAAERAFVLVPWRAVDPGAVLPGVGPVEALTRDLPADEVARVVPVPDAVLQP